MANPFISLLSNRNFRLLWLSQLLSQLTINAINFTLITKIFEQTDSTIAVSFLWISYALPAVLLLPFAGPIVDMVSRKSILVFTNFFQALIALSFLFTHREFYTIFPTVFLYSSLNQFYLPAESANIPSFVKPAQLSAANSLFLLTSQAMFILGFGAGGPIFHYLGLNSAFIIGFIMLLLATVAVLLLPADKKPSLSYTTSIGNIWHEITSGVNFIKGQKGVLFPLSILIIGQVILSIMAVIFPLVGRDLLFLPTRLSGVSIFVPAGIGALIGGLLVPRFGPGIRRRKIIETGLFGLSASLFLLALALPVIRLLLPVLENLPLLVGVSLIFAIGLSAILVFIPSLTIIQERTPEILRGRILGTITFVVSVSSLIPMIFGAAIAELLGIKLSLVMVAAIVFAVLLYSRKTGDRYITS